MLCKLEVFTIQQGWLVVQVHLLVHLFLILLVILGKEALETKGVCVPIQSFHAVSVNARHFLPVLDLFKPFPLVVGQVKEQHGCEEVRYWPDNVPLEVLS